MMDVALWLGLLVFAFALWWAIPDDNDKDQR